MRENSAILRASHGEVKSTNATERLPGGDCYMLNACDPDLSMATDSARAANVHTRALYDEVSYRAHPLGLAHPEHMAAIARFRGLEAVALENCRVLEIGCADGGHLIPMAVTIPGAKFVGIDFADAAIASGKETAGALGLQNIALHSADLLDWDPGDQKFDYIICHGFYSWVPATVRERLMELVGSHLSERGIAYISYNTYPGCHVRQILSGMMRYHTARLTSPQQRVAQAKEVMRLLKAGAAAKKYETEMLRAEADLVLERPDAVLFHDDLAEINDPVYFHEFMAHARRFGLDFLGEAEFVASTDSRFPDEVRALLAQMNVIDREQYMDFLKCRPFRATLLVRDGTQFRDDGDTSIVRSFRIASPLKPSSTAPTFEAGKVEVFSDSRGLPLHLDHPLSNAALVFLSSIWPKAVPFDDVVAGALKLLGSESAGEDHLKGLEMVLFRAYAAGLIEFHTFQPEMTRVPSERPLASPLVRYQAGRREPFVTGLQHKATKLDNELAAAVLALLDGRRDRAELLAELEAQKSSGELHIGPDVSIPENLDAILRQAAEQGLLIS